MLREREKRFYRRLVSEPVAKNVVGVFRQTMVVCEEEQAKYNVQ